MNARSRSRAAAIAVVVLVGASSVACSSGGGSTKTTTTRHAAATTTTATPPTDVSPLTGLAANAATRGRPALVVKIDNAPKGRPQYGLASADIVVEEGVEGGITRFAAIFQSGDAPLVGPVRSARTSDLHIADALNRPLFAYSGTNSNFQAIIDRSPVVNINPNKLPGAYHRDGRDGRSAPYNLFSTTPLLYGATPAGASPPAPLLAMGASAGAGMPVAKLDLHWFDKVRTDVTWSWDGQHWGRVQNGTPTIDANGPVIAPRNIVTLFVNYVDTGERDQSNSPVPEAKLTGSGDAWIVRDATLTKGKWVKTSDSDSIHLSDAAGNQIELIAGQTWIELPLPGNASVG